MTAPDSRPARDEGQRQLARLKEAEDLLRRLVQLPMFSVQGHVLRSDVEAWL